MAATPIAVMTGLVHTFAVPVPGLLCPRPAVPTGGSWAGVALLGAHRWARRQHLVLEERTDNRLNLRTLRQLNRLQNTQPIKEFVII